MANELTALRVPLRRFSWAWRPAYVEVSDGWVEFHAPGLVSHRASWRVPADEVVVVAPTDARDGSAQAPSVRTFVEPVTLPYLATTSRWTAPNLALLFAVPITWPRNMFGRANADGVMLRAVDPPLAMTTLAAAGISVTNDPEHWLTRRREMTTALHAAASAQARQGVDQWIRLAALGLVPVLGATAWWAQASRSPLAVASFAVECLAAAGTPFVLRRRDRA